MTVQLRVINSPSSRHRRNGFSVPLLLINPAFASSWRLRSESNTVLLTPSVDLVLFLAYSTACGPATKAAVNTGDQRVRSQPIGAMIALLTFARGKNPFD